MVFGAAHVVWRYAASTLLVNDSGVAQHHGCHCDADQCDMYDIGIIDQQSACHRCSLQ